MLKPHWKNRHHSFLISVTEKLHWPHKETRSHKLFRVLLNACMHLALILLGYLLAQLQNVVR